MSMVLASPGSVTAVFQAFKSFWNFRQTGSLLRAATLPGPAVMPGEALARGLPVAEGDELLQAVTAVARAAMISTAGVPIFTLDFPLRGGGLCLVSPGG